jgi:2-dehydro-3-deoxyphosphogluconate aldolase/(4S)-4-hydroxy-2-oxoglutarate aldolase
MRAKAEIIEALLNPGIIAIIRTERPEPIPEICQALLAGGVMAIEITLTVPNALEAIRNVRRQFGDQIVLGAGTVLSAASCRAALEAGAEYIVTPVTKEEIIRAANQADRPIMSGAYTPTEAQLAHELGAEFIKIFPADQLGPSYIKALRAPLPHLRIVPTGGVDVHTARAFLQAGCVALGVGSALVSAKLVQEKRWGELTSLAQQFVAVVQPAGS